MEEIIKQSFNYAQIKLFKNYSSLDIKSVLDEVDVDDIDYMTDSVTRNLLENPFGFVAIKKYVASATSRDKVHTLKLYPKDNSKKFFYADIQVPIPEGEKYVHDYHRSPSQIIKLVRVNSVCDSMAHDWFDTTKDRHIKRYYNNPFAGIKIHKIERWIKKDGDKITMKYYHHTRERNINSRYFTKHTKSMTITFNLRTGNFTTINFTKDRKSRLASFHTNTFMSLKNALGSIYHIEHVISSASVLHEQFKKEFNNELFHYAVKKGFNFNKPSLLTTFRENTNAYLELAISDFINEWTIKFIELKKIKAPNHCNRLITNFYPTEKYLKKNHRKLSAAILDRFGVMSNITIKMLHMHPNVNMLALVRLCYLFGKNYPKYVGNIKSTFFEISTNMERENDVYTKNILLDVNTRRFMDLQEAEKSNLIKVINDYVTNFKSYNVTSTHSLVDYIYDHCNMIQKVREYYPDMRMTARTYETFTQEHIELSKIERTIKTGFSIQYVFDEQTIHRIEKPIEINRLGDIDINGLYGDFANITREVFFPKILKTSEEYSEEGSYMHHCVSSYINTETSIIISLRTGRERVTCEFHIKNRSCIQARYFNNQDPPEHYKDALVELGRRIRDCYTPLNSLEKKKVRLQINGKDIVSEAPEVYPILVNDFDLQP